MSLRSAIAQKPSLFGSLGNICSTRMLLQQKSQDWEGDQHVSVHSHASASCPAGKHLFWAQQFGCIAAVITMGTRWWAAKVGGPVRACKGSTLRTCQPWQQQHQSTWQLRRLAESRRFRMTIGLSKPGKFWRIKGKTQIKGSTLKEILKVGLVEVGGQRGKQSRAEVLVVVQCLGDCNQNQEVS